MRGNMDPQADMLCLISSESRVSKDHPLRMDKLLDDLLEKGTMTSA